MPKRFWKVKTHQNWHLRYKQVLNCTKFLFWRWFILQAIEITGESIGDVQETETRVQSVTPVNVGGKIEEDQVVMEADLSDLAQMVQNSQAEFETPTVDLKDMAQIVQKGNESLFVSKG